MRLGSKRFAAAVIAAALAAPAAAYELVNGEVIAVHGDRLIARVAEGFKEIIVPRDFRFQVNGQQMGVRDLAVGTKVTATIPTPMEPVSLIATELTEAEVAYAVDATLVVKSGPEGLYERFTSEQMLDKRLLLYRNGRKLSANSLEKGDRVSATVVTKVPPVAMADVDVTTFVATAPKKSVPARTLKNAPRITYTIPLTPDGPPRPEGELDPITAPANPSGEILGTPAAQAAAKAAAEKAAAEKGAPQVLPKTASQRPALVLAGALLASLGLALTAFRRLGRAKMSA